MSKFTIVLLLVALVTMSIAKPQDSPDTGTQVNVVDGETQVNFVDGNQQVHFVDPVDIINPRAGPKATDK